MTIDWTKPIVIKATDWQEELPARVIDGRLLAIDAPHKLGRGGGDWPSGETWLYEECGILEGFPDVRIINKIEKDNKMPTQKSLDEAARAIENAPSHQALGASIAAHALALDQLHGRVEVSEAEELYRAVMGAYLGYISSYSGSLNKHDKAAIALIEAALAKRDAKPEPQWIEWIDGGVCPVPDDTRTEVKFRDGNSAQDSKPQTLDWGHYSQSYDIIAYRVL